MNRIVVYNSKSGFTKKYADWISEELGCESKSIKDIKLKDLSAYDQVIYGGALMADMIKGIGKIKKLNLSNLVVFASGLTVPSEAVISKVVEVNSIDKDKFFYFEGGFDSKKAGFFGRTIIKMIGKSIKKKENKTEDDLHMLQTISGMDRTNKEYIKPLIDYINK